MDDLFAALCREDWAMRAACRGRTDLDWHPDADTKGGVPFAERYAEQLALCRDCPVQVPCYEAAQAEPPGYGAYKIVGIRAGLSVRVRLMLRRGHEHLCRDCYERGIVRLLNHSHVEP